MLLASLLGPRTWDWPLKHFLCNSVHVKLVSSQAALLSIFFGILISVAPSQGTSLRTHYREIKKEWEEEEKAQHPAEFQPTTLWLQRVATTAAPTFENTGQQYSRKSLTISLFISRTNVASYKAFHTRACDIDEKVKDIRSLILAQVRVPLTLQFSIQKQVQPKLTFELSPFPAGF